MDKVSTSKNWAVWVHEYLKDFPNQQDVLRYVLAANMPENKDNDFTWKDFQNRNNNELVAIFGNFVNRTMVLMHKLCGGKVPRFNNKIADERDKEIGLKLQELTKKVTDSLDNFKFRDALSAAMDIAREGNRYMQEKAPWLLSKTAEDQKENQLLINNCIHVCLQLTANLAIMVNPFMPFTSRKLCHMLKVVDRMLEWENAGSMKLVKPGYSLRKPELLFSKIDKKQIQEQLDKLEKGAKEAAKTKAKEEDSHSKFSPVKSEITFDDFSKLDLRIGTIIAAEKMKNADKLLKFSVDLGFEKRTIISGLAKHHKPEDTI